MEYCFERDLEVFRITRNFKRCLKWMIGKGFLYDNKKCPCCEYPMRLVHSSSKLKDGLIFKCSRVNNHDSYALSSHSSGEVKVSIRNGTLFDGSNLTLMEAVRLVFYYFPRGFNALQAYKDLAEYNIPGLQYQYVAEMYRRIRHVIHINFQNAYRRRKLGEYGRVVEIDESKFTHHTKGGVSSKVWVLGFFERGSKDVRAFVLKDKSEASILALIQDNVAEGAEVVTDSWRGYSECGKFYRHRICNRVKPGAVDENGKPLQDNSINRVESLWHMLKRNIHTYSTVRASTL